MRRSPCSWSNTTFPTRPVVPSPGSAPGIDPRLALQGFDPDKPPRWGRLQPGRGAMAMDKHPSVMHLSCDAVERAGPLHTQYRRGRFRIVYFTPVTTLCDEMPR